MGQEEDLQQMKSLHRQLFAAVLKGCLTTPGTDADLQEFARRLPAQIDSPEGFLRRYWQEKGLSEPAVRDFALRYGRALAGSPEFRRFETEMEDLARMSGKPGFSERFASIAAARGINLP